MSTIFSTNFFTIFLQFFCLIFTRGFLFLYKYFRQIVLYRAVHKYTGLAEWALAHMQTHSLTMPLAIRKIFLNFNYPHFSAVQAAQPFIISPRIFTKDIIDSVLYIHPLSKRIITLCEGTASFFSFSHTLRSPFHDLNCYSQISNEGIFKLFLLLIPSTNHFTA